MKDGGSSDEGDAQRDQRVARVCGIAGYLGSNRPTQFATAMESALRRRGPDSSTVWGEDSANLIHTRLAIVDLSEGGRQPFFSQNGRIVVIYNGEIYNHEELRSRHNLHEADCDGAILPELWDRLGPACLDELRGMFALCVIDRWEQEMWLATDPLGMKPLYVRRGNEGVAFASESLALARIFGDETPESDAHALFEAWGSLPTHRSGVAGIQRLSPGEIRQFDQHGREVYRSSISLRHWRREPTNWSDVVEAFVEAVTLHMMSDVPVGLLLSAGVDSAAIAWAAAEAGHKLDCFTLDFRGSPGEGTEAAQIAKSYGHMHHRLSAIPDIGEVVNDFLETTDRPTCDGLNVFIVSQAIRCEGIKVALTGTGGDELFGGYGHHRRRRRPGHITEPAARGAAGLVLRAASQRRGLTPHLLDRLDQRTADSLLTALHATARGALSNSSEARVASYRAQHPAFRSMTNLFPGPSFEQLTDDAAAAELTSAEWRYYLGPTLLADADTFSMAYGLELRIPFVDVSVIATTLQVPDRVPGKYDFVNATGDAILKHIVGRPKTGFDLPMSTWLGELDLGDGASRRQETLPRLRLASHRQVLERWKQVVWQRWQQRLRDGARDRLG